MERKRVDSTGDDSMAYYEPLKIQWIIQVTKDVFDACVMENFEVGTPLEIAVRSEQIGAFLSLDSYDTLKVMGGAPSLVGMTPSELVAAVLNLRASLPEGVDPTAIVHGWPTVLATAGENGARSMKIRENWNRLQECLPEVFVGWLVTHEPWLLEDAPQARLEKLRRSVALHEQQLEEVERILRSKIQDDNIIRQWFKSEFVVETFEEHLANHLAGEWPKLKTQKDLLKGLKDLKKF